MLPKKAQLIIKSLGKKFVVEKYGEPMIVVCNYNFKFFRHSYSLVILY